MDDDILSFAGSQWLRSESCHGVVLWTELLDSPLVREYYRYRSDTKQWYFRSRGMTKYEKCDTPFIELRYQTRNIPLPVILALCTLEHYRGKAE